MNDVLKKFGLSNDDFIAAAREQIETIHQEIQGGAI
jgi:hypothetical protein